MLERQHCLNGRKTCPIELSETEVLSLEVFKPEMGMLEDLTVEGK
jgi:hypothetical protein